MTDTAEWDQTDPHRSVHLDDQGSPGYDAAVVVTGTGEERLVLARREYLNHPDRPYWPTDIRLVAPHELTGKLPKPYAPTCGRRASSSGKPCRVGVRTYGDPCPWHAAVESDAHV